MARSFRRAKVTYVLEKDGKVFIIKNVPVRICVETDERLFAPQTVESLQRTIWEERQPHRIVSMPEFEFAT